MSWWYDDVITYNPCRATVIVPEIFPSLRALICHTEGMKTSCYYDNDLCEGELWVCDSCKEEYCQTHWHVTELGKNVECVACERERLERQE
jgi:hypothetical protein